MIGGTCDQCAEGPKEIAEVDPATEAYICVDCMGFHERAIDAATEAVLAMPQVSVVVGAERYRDITREVVATAVKAYCEFTDEPRGARGW